MKSLTISCFADMVGDYTLTAYCTNHRCDRPDRHRGTELDIADLIRRGYKGEIGRKLYRCSVCGQIGSVRKAPIHTGGLRES